jgi:hypothetical protein
MCAVSSLPAVAFPRFLTRASPLLFLPASVGLKRPSHVALPLAAVSAWHGWEGKQARVPFFCWPLQEKNRSARTGAIAVICAEEEQPLPFA